MWNDAYVIVIYERMCGKVDDKHIWIADCGGIWKCVLKGLVYYVRDFVF